MSGSSRRESAGSSPLQDSKSTITILVLGDDGVGKSSLISTFVSRHFSESVPGLMTRIRLPPDPDSNTLTTIVDSQGGDQALSSAATAKSLSSPAGSSNSLQSLLKQSTAMASTTTTTAGVDSTSGVDTKAQASTTTTTSVMSSSSSSARKAAAVTGIEHVDSIVLVYDLDRPETFYRLENHWLPLIERCYSGELPVIVCGNKMDLSQISSNTGMTDEQALARSRQQIVSLMQRFRFIRQCIKCSAKNLLRVDEIFLKAQQAVLYPFNPLYDLQTGQLSRKCQQAFVRIFRMYDQDHDGLLSNAELDTFQYQTFRVPLVERDLQGWKKVVSKNNPTDEAVVQEGKFTVAGFMAIFDVFISQNRLDVPWRVLRRFGYDNELNLHVPSSLVTTAAAAEAGGSAASWKLSSSATTFLAAIFHQFDSNQDGILSSEDIAEIFKIVPDPCLPPWHPVRANFFQGCYSIPIVSLPPVAAATAASSSSTPGSPQSSLEANGNNNTNPMLLSTQSLSASGITIVSGATLPTVGGVDDISSNSSSAAEPAKPLSFLDWMSQWHMVSATAPAATRAELYRLGHVEQTSKSAKSSKTSSSRLRRSARRKSVAVPKANYEAWMSPSEAVRVLVVGSQGCGKSALLKVLCSNEDAPGNAMETTPTTRPETSTSFVKLKKKKQSTDASDDEFVVHLIFTEVPDSEEHSKELVNMIGPNTMPKHRAFDLVAFAFDCNNENSLSYAIEMEKRLLTDDVARVYIGTKSEGPAAMMEASRVVREAKEHCQELDLEPPLLTSASTKTDKRMKLLNHLARCAPIEESTVESYKSKPHEEQKRMEAARRRKMLWLGGLVSVSVAVAVGVGVLWKTGAAGENGERRAGSRLGGWLQSLFRFGQGPGGEATNE